VNLMHDIFALTEEVIVYLGEQPHPSSTVPNESTTTFYCDGRDEKALEIFRGHYDMNTDFTSAKRKTTKNYAFEIFGFLGLLSGPQLDSFSSL
jgi:hypothetical protein